MHEPAFRISFQLFLPPRKVLFCLLSGTRFSSASLPATAELPAPASKLPPLAPVRKPGRKLESKLAGSSSEAVTAGDAAVAVGDPPG